MLTAFPLQFPSSGRLCSPNLLPKFLWISQYATISDERFGEKADGRSLEKVRLLI